MDITKNLKKLRTEKKLSQSDVSKKLGFTSHNAYSHWELGKASPNVRDLDKLAEVFGVTVSELLFGDAGEQKAPTGKIEELEKEISHLKRENMILQVLAKQMGAEFPKSEGVTSLPENVNLFRPSNPMFAAMQRGLKMAV